MQMLNEKLRGYRRSEREALWRPIAGLMVLLLLLGAAVLAQNQTGEGPADFVTTGGTLDYTKTATAGDPVSVGNGAYSFRMPLLALGGPMKLGFELIYHSNFNQISPARIPLNFWWWPRAMATVRTVANGVSYATIQFPDGNQVAFKKTAAGGWILAASDENAGGIQYRDNGSSMQYALQETSTYLYLMDPIQERVYIFQREGAVLRPVVRILDRNGNQLIYTGGTFPTRIEDGLGRSLDLTYDVASNTLRTVTDQAGRRVVLNYERFSPRSDFALTSVTDPLNQTTTFNYADRTAISPGLISGVVQPQGNTPFTQSYAEATLNGSKVQRVISQRDALGNTTVLSYDANASSVTETRPDGTTVKYAHFSNNSLLKAMTDPTGKTAGFAKNTNEQMTGITDRLGGTTSFTYHAASGMLESRTNAKGDTVRFAYTFQDQTITNPINNEQVMFTFSNLTRTGYPDGTSEQFTYDARGNILTRVDPAGQTWTFTHNSRGQMLTASNPTGGVTTLTYNSDATVAAHKDSDNGTTTFAYDVLKRLTRITHPDGSFRLLAYDADDRITSITDENNRTTTFTYDANGNLTQWTDAAGRSSQFTYDALDRRTQITDRLGKKTTSAYDPLGRLASVTDATGISTSFSYDPRGWLARLTRGGRNWAVTYDDEGVASATITPLGHTSRFQTDALGYTRVVSDPLNQTITLTRDRFSRITGISDPLGRTTGFSHDQRGWLTRVVLPVVGAATYRRDGLGQITEVSDLNGQSWVFSNTLMGRLASEGDPLGRAWQHSYDSRGRLTKTVFPDGASMTTSYDAAGNPSRRLYSDGTDLQFSYDALNRLTQANGIQLTYDAEGRVTNTNNAATNFEASYDDAGRLRTATYNNGAFAVTYTYDAATGLLSRVSDNLTNTQLGFGYDDDFRLTTITRPNGVHTTLTWDNAARLTRIQEGSIVDLKYTLDAAGQATQLEMKAPLDPVGSLTAGSESFAYNAASQLTSTGYVLDPRGRLTAAPGRSFRWDGASRLVGIDSVTLTCNGLGQLVTRTEGGTTIRYYYNHALALAPLVAEKNDTSGRFLRYYVWRPDGALLYMIDAADGNKIYYYHFDRTGSTLALTDAAGAVSGAYAYDPYGRVLSRQGAHPQPFTLIGQRGVRQEGNTGTLYQMRARYYDAVTARFLSREPVWPRIVDPRELNPYQYAELNPVTKVDFTGLDTQETDAGRVPPNLPEGTTNREDLQGIRKLYGDYEVSLVSWLYIWETLVIDKYIDSIEREVKSRERWPDLLPQELTEIIRKARRVERDIRIFRALIGKTGANISITLEERTKEREALEAQIRERGARYQSLEKRFEELSVKHFGQKRELSDYIYR